MHSAALWTALVLMILNFTRLVSHAKDDDTATKRLASLILWALCAYGGWGIGAAIVGAG